MPSSSQEKKRYETEFARVQDFRAGQARACREWWAAFYVTGGVIGGGAGAFIAWDACSKSMILPCGNILLGQLALTPATAYGICIVSGLLIGMIAGLLIAATSKHSPRVVNRVKLMSGATLHAKITLFTDPIEHPDFEDHERKSDGERELPADDGGYDSDGEAMHHDVRKVVFL